MKKHIKLYQNILKKKNFNKDKLFFALILFLLNPVTFVNGRTDIKILQNRIDSILTTVNCLSSVQVASASNYDLLYEYKPSEKMIPASITKLITSAAALMKLGLSYEFKTVLYTDDNNLSDGIINGNVYLKGYGDPDFSYDDIGKLVNQVLNWNITEITGNIIYDVSFLDTIHYGLANYYQGDTGPSYWPYVSAINLDKNKKISNPASYTAEVIYTELQNQNVRIDGIVIAGITPTSSKELGKVTRSICDVLAYMNKASDNHSAITVYKVLGAEVKSPPGSLENGSEVIIDFLSAVGIDRNNYEILEGSGLSRYNMVTSDVFIMLLKYMYDKVNTFDCFYKTLAVAGIDGTLKERMKGTEAEKNVHAKTGTLNSVSTLSGYAVSRDNELIIFYIAMNGFGTKANYYRKRQDDICEVICQFSRK